jgi:hypothetical protein
MQLCASSLVALSLRFGNFLGTRAEANKPSSDSGWAVHRKGGGSRYEVKDKN